MPVGGKMAGQVEGEEASIPEVNVIVHTDMMNTDDLLAQVPPGQRRVTRTDTFSEPLSDNESEDTQHATDNEQDTKSKQRMVLGSEEEPAPTQCPDVQEKSDNDKERKGTEIEDALEERDTDLTTVIMLEDENYMRRLRIVYYAGFSPMHIDKFTEPKSPFIAADRWDSAVSDTNWFAWWTKRGYYYMEAVRIVWKQGEDWTGKKIVLFKKQGLARFSFQAGSDVIL